MSSHDHDHGHGVHTNDHNDHHDHHNNHSGGGGGGESEDATQRRNVLRRLYTATILCSCFIVVEVTGGILSNSLAVLSDAAHLFADLASFAVAIAASYLASLPATQNHTFGLKRSESLAALFSMVSLAFVSVGLGYEAIRRLVESPQNGVDGPMMSLIAGIGVFVNVVLAFVLGEHHVHLPGGGGHDHDHSHDHGHLDDDDHNRQVSHGHADEEVAGQHNHAGHDHDHSHSDHARANSESAMLLSNENGTDLKFFDSFEHHDDGDGEKHRDALHEKKRNINLHAAYLHVLADLAQSVAVLIGGIVIWVNPKWHIVDPILTLGFCVLVLYNSLGVLRQSVAVLLEEIPPNVNWQEVFNAICEVPDVYDVHDLHIWCISHGTSALSVHCQSADPQALYKINCVILKFGIKHSAIQVQIQEGPCITCDMDGCCTHHLSSRNSMICGAEHPKKL